MDEYNNYRIKLFLNPNAIKLICVFMIEVSEIYKSFDGEKVLKGISTTFEKGDTSMIIGSSGSGKTVLLKCLSGLFEPDSGDICYDGRHYSEMTLKEKRDLRKEMGMVFQGGALFDSETIQNNIMFPLKMFTQQSEEEMLERVNFVLNRVNLENVNQKYPAELSGGMQKRVAIARAIVMNPKYLFCDEPNSGLDPKTAIVIDNLIQEITDEYQIITIINSHDMNSVMEIGEKIIFLKDGLKAWEGTYKTIFKTENEAVTDFVYSSSLNKKVREIYNKEGS
jgi:phospholipid/cholesterol/gamma-HCH transport system ATP-binding protein